MCAPEQERARQAALMAEIGRKGSVSGRRKGIISAKSGLTALRSMSRKAGSGLERVRCLRLNIRCLGTLVRHRYFERLMLLAIILNTVVLASYYHDMPAEHERVNEYINLALSGLFTVEMVLKLAGLSIYAYFSDRWNAFDGFIVVTSLVEFIMSYGGVEGGANVSVLRTFRLPAGTSCRRPCRTTAPRRPTWCRLGPRPLLRTPERRLRGVGSVPWPP